jgi:transcription elongation factor Elf1
MPLFIIFGISSRQKAKTAGQFNCPVCTAPRSYSELRTSRYFSLFFIPLIPLGSSSTGRVVCNHCGTEFDNRVVS